MSQSNLARGRQHRAIACDECRRRKVRCDGQQPQCGVCRDSGSLCAATQRGARGPKKGYITELKNRVVQLEAMLDQQRHQQQQPSSAGPSAEISPTEPLAESLNTTAVDSVSWPATATALDADMLLPSLSVSELGSLAEWPMASTVPWATSPLQITNVTQAELDQLYFDRVHPSIPLLHQRRYLTWSQSETKSQSRVCLQYAMWALATLLSVQFRDMTEALYQETKRMLESVVGNGDGQSGCDTELMQAWVLVSICESMRTHHRQAWMSAGRLFRLVQAMRFHEIDSPKNDTAGSSPGSGDYIPDEERRRVFWMAYLLDHLFSMRNDWPITLNEHVICTRLPASEPDFQNGHLMLGPFLSEATTDSSLPILSPFNECIILVTLCGRSLLHEQQSQISKAYGNQLLDGDQRQWMNSMLVSRLQILSECYPSPTEARDPLLLFAHILGQATVIYFCKGGLELETSLVRSGDIIPEAMNCDNRALAAAASMVSLAAILCDLHFSKIHPFMPFPLFLAAEFLYDNSSKHESYVQHLHNFAEVFRHLKNVNNLEQSYVDLLPRSCISKTNELLNSGAVDRDASRSDG
ncbi:hypothetical protein BDV12DRAFT_128559 [Aspergillus spectabilis]